ncbi:YajQ family cyclic di-GMP-binding protein [Rhodoferax sp. U2-2l]|uniref:YajQ family cyclic di-GMP-binding protein n=1 Tax=Rhodoferax sp. U2-2l TaxID=2884000 RepID=UPI001D0B1AFB|nr:YajQ family cyclic di-GMP-binding protein [Rhodoferax sp. U2-2l]MCB8747521.1 YajQ family cyclic di-GMP-binding protein [Rhodoferax sp. U2-2l]
MPSFDTVCEAKMVDVKHAVENTSKEIATRFDFKGTPAAVELKDKEITLIGDADFQLSQIEDILRNKLTKREVDVRFLDKGDVQKIGGDKVKQVIKIRDGIETELAKKIQRLIKDSKIKVQAAIQDGKLRVTGKDRDDLQAAQALMRKEITDIPLSFDNYRD